MPRKGETTSDRYGWSHQKLRKYWRGVVAGGGVVCPRCGFVILPGSKWDLGHDDYGGYSGPEHRYCNRRAGARLGNRLRRARRARIVSREW